MIRTLQEKIKETNAMIERELGKRREEDKEANEEIDVLVHRLGILEKELYKQWTENQHRTFAKWLGKLNKLGYNKASRTFFQELNRKNRSKEHFGPIVNKEGEISTSRKQCLENW